MIDSLFWFNKLRCQILTISSFWVVEICFVPFLLVGLFLGKKQYKAVKLKVVIAVIVDCSPNFTYLCSGLGDSNLWSLIPAVNTNTAECLFAKHCLNLGELDCLSVVTPLLPQQHYLLDWVGGTGPSVLFLCYQLCAELSIGFSSCRLRQKLNWGGGFTWPQMTPTSLTTAVTTARSTTTQVVSATLMRTPQGLNTWDPH